MAKVFAFLAEGLEEVECLAVVDVLRRAGVETRLVSVTGNRMVTGSQMCIRDRYRGDDTFTSTVRAALEERAKAYEQETGIKVVMDIVDAKLNQNTQNSQVERFISLGYDALCVNIVDRSAASIIIDKAMDAGIPVVFFNREPVEEDMNRWEKLYYVGADAKELSLIHILKDRSERQWRRRL